MKNLIYIGLRLALASVLLISCGKEALEPTLAQNKTVEGNITSQQDVFGILNGAYNRLTTSSYYGRDMIIYGEVRSDNCFSNGASGRFLTVSSMDMNDNDGYASGTWSAIYRVIASANILIGLNPADISGDADLINHYIGQAYALRALAHFDLLKLYGQQHTGGTLGIPYIRVYKGDDLNPARNSVEVVKSFIFADIDQALSLMSDTLNEPLKEKLTTYGVYALQSRVATYFGDWNKVISASEEIINSGVFRIVPAASFATSWHLDASVNSIFELAFSHEDNLGSNGLQVIYRGNVYGDIEVLADLLQIFDDTDVRASAFMIGIESPSGLLRNMGKYPSLSQSDNISIFRYEEVLLNYAEAHFELGTGDPQGILNQITAERGALAYTSISKEIILKERRRELCFEGFRFDDLARTGNNIPEVAPLKQTHGGPTYGSYNYAFPIPEFEMNANNSMVQNPGYN